MHAWADVATLIKSKALKGRFVAQEAANLPFVPGPGTEVAFVPPQIDAARRGVVSRVEPLQGGRYEIWFEGLGQSDTEVLVGCHILVRRAVIDEGFFADEPAAWQGWDVMDEEGLPIGSVERIEEKPGQDLIELKRVDSDRGVLVPLVDEFIVAIDVERETIVMKLPEGLLAL